MPRPLRKPALLDRITQAVRLSGWDSVILSDAHPFRLSIFRGDSKVITLCYIWNMTHGGYPRDPNELRIQVTGVDRFVIDPPAKTLLLGWSEDEAMFAGFDVTKHLIDMSGRSPSLQIRRESLQGARGRGFLPQTRANDEIAIAFEPDFFATYAQEVEALHSTAQHRTDLGVLERIARTDARGRTTEIRDIPAGERRTVLQEIERKVRDARFRKNILSAYRFRCAASDIQLDLLDAAHIVPVEHDRGTDELKNGLCLSAIHHRAFDRGLLGIKRDYSIVFNETRFGALRSIGWDGGENDFKRSCRDRINLPARSEFYPDPEYLIVGQVLRGWNPRELA